MPRFGLRCQIRYCEAMPQQRYLGAHAPDGAASVSKFLTAVTIGQAAGWGAAALARGGFHKDSCSTREAVDMFVSNGVFLLIGGLSWVLLTRER
jgi:hypothetical protein